jgi:hypothetical protein
VNYGFEFPVFRLMLFVWFTLIGANNTHAESASAGASASVLAPISVNNVVAVYWNTLVSPDPSVGSVLIRIAGAGWSGDTSGAGPGALGYFTVPKNIRLRESALAQRIRFASETGMLGGTIAVDLMISAVGPQIALTVAYN